MKTVVAGAATAAAGVAVAAAAAKRAVPVMKPLTKTCPRSTTPSRRRRWSAIRLSESRRLQSSTPRSLRTTLTRRTAPSSTVVRGTPAGPSTRRTTPVSALTGDPKEQSSLVAVERSADVLRAGGVGCSLVCLPGGPGFPGRHLGNLGGLDVTCALVRPDWRGAGASDPPADGRHSVQSYVADLESLRCHLGLERIDLFGHSFGGLVAATYAARHPDNVRLLVLDGTPDVLGDGRAPRVAAGQDSSPRGTNVHTSTARSLRRFCMSPPRPGSRSMSTARST